MVENKKDKLVSILKELGSFVVAFSGGVDSTFLLYLAHSIGNLRAIGVTIRTPYIPEIEIVEAVDFVETHGIDHHILNLTFPESIRNNPLDRCYLCKKILFSELSDYARNNGYKYVVDGTNADDTGDFRPGLRALKELEIRSPLLEAGFTKRDIRDFLREKGLTIWDKPAKACLLTRIPYNTSVNEGMLGMIEQAELFLLERGFPGIRVRIHDDLARIECPPDYFDKILKNPDRELIINKLKNIGFRFVTLDLEGYRTGSLNPETNNL